MPKRRTKKSRKPAGSPLLRRLTRGPTVLAVAVVGAIAGFVVLVAVSVMTTGDDKIERIQDISAEGRSRGSDTAPVTIITFGDFQCPMCKRFAETTGNQIEAEYIANDLVRLEYRNMAFLGAESVWAAEAAQCATDQDKFWEYHDKLFEKQAAENSGALSGDRLKRFAGELGLNQEAFDECLDSHRHQQLVLDETEAGQEAGVTSTPWAFVNGETVKGAQPFADFQRVIDEQLEEAAKAQ